jgi:hypothetical protein
MMTQLHIGKQSSRHTASLYLLQLLIKVLNTKPRDTYALYPMLPLYHDKMKAPQKSQ